MFYIGVSDFWRKEGSSSVNNVTLTGIRILQGSLSLFIQFSVRNYFS